MASFFWEVWSQSENFLRLSPFKELAFDPTKRFIQVETAFFWRWWNEQNEFMKDLVKDLVAEGM